MADQSYLTVPHLDRSALARLFSKIRIDPSNGCWIWTAALMNGYGTVWINGRQERSHRVMWAWLVGPIERGLNASIPVLDHYVCENPLCCNPAHIRLVMNVENLRRTGSISAVNRRKTHCKRGHALPCYPNRRDCVGRQCPVCRAQVAAAYYQRVGKTKQRAKRAHERISRA